jgi:hypothetical protein
MLHSSANLPPGEQAYGSNWGCFLPAVTHIKSASPATAETTDANKMPNLALVTGTVENIGRRPSERGHAPGQVAGIGVAPGCVGCAELLEVAYLSLSIG